MLQMAKNKYSVETLRELNVSYDHEHGLTQKDVLILFVEIEVGLVVKLNAMKLLSVAKTKIGIGIKR